MPNYREAKIYTIRSLSREDLIYVGSTCQPLSKRLYEHKCHKNTTSSRVTDIGDSYIELHKNYPCDSKAELHRAEGIVMRSLNCVNKCIAGRTKQEYDRENRHLRIQRGIDNADNINQQRKQYIKKITRICVCGRKYRTTPYKTNEHYNSPGHIKWVSDFYMRLNNIEFYKRLYALKVH